MDNGDQNRPLALAMIRTAEQYRWTASRHYVIDPTAIITLGRVYADGLLPIGELAAALRITNG